MDFLSTLFGKAEETYEDIIAPLARIVDSLEARQFKRLADIEQNAKRISELADANVAAREEIEKIKAAGERIRALFTTI